MNNIYTLNYYKNQFSKTMMYYLHLIIFKEKNMRNKTQHQEDFKFIPFLISLIIPLTLGLIVYLLIPNMKALYETLEKPFWALPSIAFPIAWTILYILMGIASYKVYIKKYENIDVSSALFVYAIQLLLNILLMNC